MKALFLTSLLFLSSAQAADPTVTGNNDVGLNFMTEVTKSEVAKGEKNIMTSPVSLYYALSLAYNGTAGATFDQLSKYLGNTDTLAKYNKGAQDYREGAVLAPAQPKNQWDPKPPVFGISNSAWASSNTSPSGGHFTFAKDYVTSIKKYYDAEVQVLDFKDPSAADAINGWAKQKTNGLIPKVLEADAISDLMWVLMNATYIEAQWQEPFTKMYAPNAPQFNAIDGTQKTADMMSNKGYYAYAANNETQAIALPFAGSNDLAFYIVLPKDIATFKAWRAGKAWDAQMWNDLMATLTQTAIDGKTNLVVPKFSFAYSVTMKDGEELTKSTGLQFLFEDIANFSKMATSDSITSKVGLIKQDTKIEFDENGVKAAAVTTIGGMESLSVEMGPKNEMIVDRPFFFAIGDKKAGALLFLGAVVDPTAQ